MGELRLFVLYLTLRYYQNMKNRFGHYFISAVLGFFMISSAAQAQAVPTVDFTVNDTFYNRQWYMDFIHAPKAWSLVESSEREVVVALIDGGVDDSHPDLKGVLWQDVDESIDGKDNDGDGLIDDSHGWNFVSNSEDTRPITSKYGNDAWEHGTVTASLIAARGNDDIGIAGVAWNVKIMPLVILDSNGLGSTDNLVTAIDYAVRHRADIINMSLEGNSMDENVADAIKRATSQGVLVVIAAGNGYDSMGFNFDDMPLFPACHKGAADQSVLVVTALSSDGTKYESANYGNCVNIAAPGHDLFAAKPTYDPDGNHQEVSGYGSWSGTSLSAPLVTGVAALLKAQHPTWTGEQLAQRILDTAQPFSHPDMAEAGLGVGVLDAGNALQKADAHVYGPWNLFTANQGTQPMVYIQDESGNDLFTFQAGNSGDTRGLRASFVRWDDDRYPEVMVSTIGDQSGSWRVYRTDGVLLAAGQAADGGVMGGLNLSTQDLYADNRDVVLLSEALGSRAWEITPQNPTAEPIEVVEKPEPLGVMAVGVQRPTQSFVILGRSKDQSQLATMDYWSYNEGTYIDTPHPQNLSMTSAQTIDNREVLRFVQSGEPSYMMEIGGGMKIVDQAKIWRYMQAPLGMVINDNSERLFYDTWPR